MHNYCVKEIWQVDELTLGIIWSDQKEMNFNVLTLREQCPCATCKDLREKKEFRISPDIRPRVIKSVGRHALNIVFSDGHRTGFYTFDMLRALKP